MSHEPAPEGYDARAYPPFAVTVDIVVFTLVNWVLHVLLIRRGGPPHEGRWALPGGFVRPDESLAEAAERELREETGVDAAPFLEQLRAYGDPDRDPRMRVVSVAFVAVLRDTGPLVAGTDAAVAALVPLADILERGKYPLAFDHDQILRDGLAAVAEKLQRTSLAAAFVGPEFTLSDLRSVYENTWGQDIDPANFRRKILSTPGMFRRTRKRRAATSEGGKPADLYETGDITEYDIPFLPPARSSATAFAPSASTAPRSVSAVRARRAFDNSAVADRAVETSRAQRSRGTPQGADPVEIARRLTEGPTERLSAIESGTGGPAGIFLLWYRAEPLYLGRARKAAGEAKPSNLGQADGVRGRLRGIRRQPTPTIQRAIAHWFPDDVHPDDMSPASVASALQQHGECRYVELPSGDLVDEIFPEVQDELIRRSVVPLTLRRT